MDILWAISNASTSTGARMSEASPPVSPSASRIAFASPGMVNRRPTLGRNVRRLSSQNYLLSKSDPFLDTQDPIDEYDPLDDALRTGNFAVPTPAYSDGSWDMYQDFVGGVQFWGYALASGSADGCVRMWDSALSCGRLVNRLTRGSADRAESPNARRAHAARDLPPIRRNASHLRFARQVDPHLGLAHGQSRGHDPLRWPHHCAAIRHSEDCGGGRRECRTGGFLIALQAWLTLWQTYNRTTLQHDSLSLNGHTSPVERLRFMDRYLTSGGKE
jgi:division protein 1